MEQQEIQERNKEIALMLGLKPLTRPYLGAYQPTSDTSNPSFYHERIEGESWYVYPEYDSDWNWLMEAVEFIESLYDHPNKEIQVHIKPGEICIFSMPYVLENNNYKEVYYLGDGYVDKYLSTVDKSKIEAVFIAVSNFAKLYNEKKI